MQIPHEAVLLRIFIGESDRWEHHPLYEAIVLKAREAHLAGATVLRGPMGFGKSSRLHTAKILRLSMDLPVVIEIVDSEDKINAFLPVLDPMIGGGLVTVEKVKVIATLKLIGAPNSVIVRMIMEQSLFLTVAGFASGYVLLITNLHRFPRTLYLLPSDTAITFGVMFMGGILASFVGVWRAMMTHPSVALGD